MPRPFRGHRPLIACLLAAGLGAGLLSASDAHAAFIGCRADPIVTLSNGLVVNFGATIYDAPTDLNSVSYTLHAPVGTSVLSVVYPLDPNGIAQTFSFYADNPANVWDSYTFVDTKTVGINVTATASVTGLAMFSVNGTDHQNVHVHVQAPGGEGGHSVSDNGHGHGK